MDRTDPSGEINEDDIDQVLMANPELGGPEIGFAIHEAVVGTEAAARLVVGLAKGVEAGVEAREVSAAARAAQLAKNVEQGAKGEAQVASKLGDKVAGQRVTLESTTGKRSVADIVTKDKGVVEVKTGNSPLSSGQKAVKADIDAGREVIPRGSNAEKAGLTPGQPVKMTSCTVERLPGC